MYTLKPITKALYTIATLPSYCFIPTLSCICLKKNISLYHLGYVSCIFELINYFLISSNICLRFLVFIFFFFFLYYFVGDYAFLGFAIALSSFNSKNKLMNFKIQNFLRVLTILCIPIFIYFFIPLSIVLIVLNIYYQTKICFNKINFHKKNLIKKIFIEKKIILLVFFHNFIYFLFSLSLPMLLENKTPFLVSFLFFINWLIFFIKDLSIFYKTKLMTTITLSLLLNGITIFLLGSTSNFFIVCILLLFQGLFAGLSELFFRVPDFIQNKYFFTTIWKIGGILGCISNSLIINGSVEFYIAGILAISIGIILLIRRPLC